MNRHVWVAGALMLALSSTALVPVAAAAAAPTPARLATAAAGHPSADTTPTPPAPPAPATSYPLRRGDVGPLVSAVQVRLNYLGAGLAVSGVLDKPTMKAVVAFRTKFFLGRAHTVSKATIKRLKAVTRAKGKLPKQCRTVRLSLCVDKTQKLLRVVRKGTVVLTVDARMGASSTPTREGAFRVFTKSRHHVSSLYKVPMPYAMFFSGGQAVHYSPFFHRDGYYGASHGCVGVRSTKVAAKLFRTVPIGTRVYVYRS